KYIAEATLCLDLTLSPYPLPTLLCRALVRVSPRRPTWFLGKSCDGWGVSQPVFFRKWQRHYWWPSKKDHGTQKTDLEGGLDGQYLEEPSPVVRYTKAQRRTVNVPRRIYILGVGNIGGFTAHSLAGIPNRPPMTLLFSSRISMNNWDEQGQSLKLTSHGLQDTKSEFDVEYVQRPRPVAEEAPEVEEVKGTSPSVPAEAPEVEQTGETIHNLIVSTKAFHTVDALKRVAHRLTSESSILFLQNGMGIIEEVNERVFPEPEKRPQYLQGVISHGVKQIKPFSLSYSGRGTTALAILPRNIEEIKPDFEPSALYLLRTMTRTPVLAAVGFPPTDLLQFQIEKLAANAIINPLTALLNCSNGELLNRPSISRVIRLLLAEISLVIKALPELQGVPNVKMRFDIRRLEHIVIDLAGQTAANKSSMLQDIHGGSRTEIDYITGYLVRRGEEVGIQCILNYMLQHMVKAKDRLEGERRGKYTAFG
ncbi:MAG: hypothetical protein Q9183_002975, partial [Haloplaca sp. 2 TL-2023]